MSLEEGMCFDLFIFFGGWVGGFEFGCTLINVWLLIYTSVFNKHVQRNIVLLFNYRK